MDASTPPQVDPATSALSLSVLTLDIRPTLDPGARVPSGAEPLLQLRALEHAGDPELQREYFKVFLTDDGAVQVQAILRLEEGDTALDLLYPEAAPNWGLRIENLPDTGSRFTRLDVDSRLPTGDSLTITAQEAATFANRIQVARQERLHASRQQQTDGDEGGQGSENDPTKPIH